MFKKYSFLFFSFLILFGGIAKAESSEWVKSEHVELRIKDEKGMFGIDARMDPKWHIYYKDPGESGWGTEFDWSGSKNIDIKEVQFPEYEKYEEYGIKTNVYFDNVFFPIVTDRKADGILKMNVKGAVCNEICLPFEVDLEANVGEGSPTNFVSPEEVSSSEFTFGIILTAFLAGLILNIMPCVLPVLSLKVLSVVKQSGKDLKTSRKNFMATAMGIITSFFVLAIATAIFKNLGHSLGWGLHFQSPIFVGVLMLITLIFGISLFGFFHLRVPSWISDQGSNSDSLTGNFMAGVLATLLGTACTAPVLVTAVSFALTGGYTAIFGTFLIMGIGMALPYLLFAFRPQLAGFLPKPGKWMEITKKIMGLMLIGTAIWLGNILFTQVQSDMIENQDSKIIWQEFDEAAISTLVAEGKTIFVDITAKWCVNCQVNKLRVMSTDEIEAVYSLNDVVTMRGDMTKPRQDLLDYIKEYDRYGIPFNIVYGPNAPDGILLDTLLSKDAVKEAINKAKK